MRHHPIFEAWQTYDRLVVPPAASDVQREECRRAFYAGATATFHAVLDATEPDDESECDRRLQAIQEEIQNVTKDLSI